MPARKPNTRRSTASSRGRFAAVSHQKEKKTPTSSRQSTPNVPSRKSTVTSTGRRGGKTQKTPRSAPKSAARKKTPWDDSGSEDEARLLDFDSDSSRDEESGAEVDSEGMIPSSDDEPLDEITSKKPRVVRKPSFLKKKSAVKGPKAVVSGLEEEAESGSDNDGGDADFDDNNEDEGAMEYVDERYRMPSPIWNLKQCPWVEAPDLPKLDLPPSSEDLLVPNRLVFDALEVYEICRRFSQTIKLSPFLFEDFCAALMSKEQSKIIAEIHMALLRLLIKEDDDEKNVVFTPTDMRDSQNITVYLTDTMTYAEVLRQYLDSDKKRFPKSILSIVADNNYPFVLPAQRLTVMKWLCAKFLQSNSFRREMKANGALNHDEHCRDCGKPGQLLCCDGCPAAYHLECLVPPLKVCPAESEQWYCVICQQHKVNGVTDCMSILEQKGELIRQESLGFDRHGRRYAFLARRIFVQKEDTSEAWYYSTLPQLRQLLARLDEHQWESSLCEALKDLLPEIASQMVITAQLTENGKPTKKSYFQSVNEIIMAEVEKERAKKESFEEKAPELAHFSEKKSENLSKFFEQKLQEISKPAFCNGEWKEGEESNKPGELGIFDSMKEFERRSVTPGVDSDENLLEAVTENTLDKMTIQKRNCMGDLVDRVIEEIGWEDSSFKTQQDSIKPAVQESANRVGIPGRMNRLTAPNVRNSPHVLNPKTEPDSDQFCVIDPDVLYKLGMDPNRGYRRYMNQYSINDYAKNPYLRAQERARQNIMEKKFSLCDNGKFQWPCLIEKKLSTDHNLDIFLEQSDINRIIGKSMDRFIEKIPSQFWHRAWIGMERNIFRRKSLTAQGPNQLREMLAQMEMNLRPCVLQKAWYDHLGHTRMVRQTPADREERIKAEKRAKQRQKALLSADPEEESETLIWIKYTRLGGPPGHQIWKQKDEGFRVNSEGSLGGWMWVSCLRTPHYENPQLTVPDNNKLSLNGPAIKKKRRLESLIQGFINKREEEWTMESRNRQKEVQTSVCYSPSCRMGLPFLPVAGVNSAAQTCYNPMCRRKFKEALEALPKDTADKVKVPPSPKSHSKVSGGKVELRKNLGKDTPFPPPTAQSFRARHSQNKRSILVIPRSTVAKIARVGGMKLINVPGFRWDSRNSHLWPYPCARPTLQTCWRYLTQTGRSLHAVALQLRILWANVRWEEMEETKEIDFKHKITKEDRVETREVKDHKELPPNGVLTQYLVKKITTPLIEINPANEEEDDEDWTPTPRRSAGNKSLRERPKKVGRSSKGTPPGKTGSGQRFLALNKATAKEEWVDENKLFLWEIKNYWTRYESQKMADAKKVDLEKKALLPETKGISATAGGTPFGPRGTPFRLRGGVPGGVPPNLRLSSSTNNPRSPQTISNWRARDLSNIQQRDAKYTLKSPMGYVHQRGSATGQGRGIVVRPYMGTPSGVGRGGYMRGGVGLLRRGRGSMNMPPTIRREGYSAQRGDRRTQFQLDDEDDESASDLEDDQDFFHDEEDGLTPMNIVTPPGNTSAYRLAPPVRLQQQGLSGPLRGSPRMAAPMQVMGRAPGGSPMMGGNRAMVVRKVLSSGGQPKLLIMQPKQTPQEPCDEGSSTETALPRKPPFIFAQRPSIVQSRAAPFGSAAVGLGAFPGRNRIPLRKPLPVSQPSGSNTDSSVVGASVDELGLTRTPEGPDRARGPVESIMHVKEADGTIRLVRNVGGRPSHFPNIAPARTTEVSHYQPISSKPDSQSYNWGGYRVKQTDTLQQEKVEEGGMEAQTLTQAVQRRVPYIADDNESSKKILEFQRQNRAVAQSRYHTQDVSNSKVWERSIKSEKEDDSLIDVGSPNDLGLNFSDSRRLSISESRISRIRGGPSGPFEIRQQQVYPSSGMAHPRRPYMAQRMSSATYFSDPRLLQDRQQQVSTLTPAAALEMRTKRRQELESQKTCKDLLKYLVDTVVKEEKDEQKRIERELKKMMRKEYDRIYRVRKKYEKEVDLLVQERMQTLKKEINKRRLIIEQEAEAQARIGLFDQTRGKPAAEAHRRKGKLSERLLRTSGALTGPSRVPEPTHHSIKRSKRDSDSVYEGISPKKRPSEKDKQKLEFAMCCKTPYDPTRFYVKCDLCSDWFHGSCVGINAKKSRKIKAWSCNKCREEVKKTEKELYCLCRTPYDPAQFYVGCDGCEGWYHPICVGINKSEAEAMEQYFCPKCSAGGSKNTVTANQQPLTRQNYTKLFEILECLKENRNSWPFRLPVDPNQFPNYYVMIREPMDLQTVEEKLSQFDYMKLQDFVADISKIFDNARLFNAKDSAIHQCAVILEKRFDESLAKMKELIALEQAKEEAEHQQAQMERQQQMQIQEQQQLSDSRQNLTTSTDESFSMPEEEEVEVEEVQVDVEGVMDDGIIQMSDGELFLGGENIVVVDGDGNQLSPTEGEMYNEFIEMQHDTE